MNRFIVAAAVFTAALGPHLAHAQTEEVAPEALRKEAMTKTSTTVPDGWKVTAKIGGAFNLTNAQKVVGAVEGTAIQLGLNIEGEAKYKKGQHTVDTLLTIRETFQSTPTPDDEFGPLVKSLDNLSILSTYIYRFTEPAWLGPFAQFKLDTQLLQTVVEPTTPYQRIRQFSNGDIDVDPPIREKGDTFNQSKPFEPLLLRQIGGLFAEPYKEDILTADFKLGVGAQQTIARDGFALLSAESATVDGRDITIFTLQQLESSVDFGIEATAKAKGYILKDILTWNATVIAFLPAVSSTDVTDPETGDELNAFERTNLEFSGGLALKITKYAAIEYNLLVRRFPQILNDYQIQNTFQLTLTVDVL